VIATSVYVHFPWCLAKCPYCDFASGAIRPAEVPHTRYADALLRELEARAPALGERRLASVFFGGGTPSLWDPRQLGRVLAAVRAAFPLEEPDLEVTVECNPTSLDRAKAAALREAGVTRLSIGMQSLDAERLRFLGRLHDPEGALRAVREALLEVPRVSGDLMFGMPGQKAEDLTAEIEQVLETGVRHVSAYALTIEPGTQFGALYRKGKLKVAPEDDRMTKGGQGWGGRVGALGDGRHRRGGCRDGRPGGDRRNARHRRPGGEQGEQGEQEGVSVHRHRSSCGG